MSTVFSQDRQFEWCVRPIIQIYRSCAEDVLKYFFQIQAPQALAETKKVIVSEKSEAEGIAYGLRQTSLLQFK